MTGINNDSIGGLRVTGEREAGIQVRNRSHTKMIHRRIGISKGIGIQWNKRKGGNETNMANAKCSRLELY